MASHTDSDLRTDDWYRRAVVYQIYVRSFADGDGDGTGDIAGIRRRLPHLASLGIDAIWVNPWYVSPLLDGGYDVADYRSIDPRYGTVDEATAFIEEAAALGIRVLVDLVPNHTSFEHAWFRAALDSPPGSPERARYHFVDGRGVDGESPPNDWPSVFGGPAWTRVDDGQWYLHLFDHSQPDLNWELPEVRDEFESILRFWLDRGAAGFRVDVAHSLVKAPGYPDLGEEYSAADGPAWKEGHPFWDRDGVHEIIRGWRSVLDEYDDRMMVAEAWVRPDRRHLYVRPDEYHQAFDFDFLRSPWSATEFAARLETAFEQSRLAGSTNTWVLSNHDVVRHSTRYSLPDDVDAEEWLLDGDRDLLDEATGARRARAAILLVLALPGSVYLYQGEELGLPEAYDLPLDVLDDPVWENSNHRRKGRDGCRVPIPWTTDGPSLGFGSGEPWLPQPEGFAERSVEAQEADPSSMLHLYRRALRLRSELLVRPAESDPSSTSASEAATSSSSASSSSTSSSDRGEAKRGSGSSESADGAAVVSVVDDVLTVVAGHGVRCVVNMSGAPVEVPEGEILLASGHLDDGLLGVDDAVWVR